MAAPCRLLRSFGNKLLECSHVARVTASAAQWSRLPSACATFRLQHSASDTPASLAAEAEKTPVIIDNDLITKMMDQMEDSMPVSDMPDPFQKEHKRCILCKYDVDLNYKNVRLLSQFVSPYTGRIYSRAVTGLCIPMQKRVARTIKQSRKAGYMPYMLKKPEYLKDPRLFDPFKPTKG